ncbi:Glycosyl hydrolases family 39 [Epilithonimonas bovis DSM 19482]|uniref:Glycosyl hydrolases family 39 n=1 Tax=Epilithonimonas bovis DSM 19482 TaxID=1121284 RepID=A0A1U7PVF6_9FLAO|nr:hypothetical protein [Epilithonimonas bovis]SIT97535.1 Glycosyl hydrolases family 39 [Epilithonimonas bovis DSM 19482]
MRSLRKSFSFISILLIGLLIFFYNILFSQKSITIDFSKKIEKRQSMIGFLHVNDLNPLINDIKELKPRYWRVGNSLVDKDLRDRQFEIMRKYNITPILVLTDFYSHYDKRKYDWKQPYKETEAFAQLVEDFYKQYGNTVIYDIWNEPNYPPFWDGDRQQFFISFKAAYDKIRSLPGGDKAIITGPSTARFDKEFIESFLDYCNKNNVKIDILNWHLNEDIQHALELSQQIDYAQNYWKKKYPNVGFKDVAIYEFIGEDDYFKPLTSLAYINVLDREGVPGIKTCGNANGESTCINNSIDGLLTPEGKPRSVWWVYKYYADSLPARFNTSVDSDRTAAISYFSKDTNSVNVLFGNLGKFSSSFSIDLNSIRRFSLFSKTNEIKYTLYRIPNTEQKELPNPIVLQSGSIHLSSKKMNTIDFKNIDVESVYLLKINN